MKKTIDFSRFSTIKMGIKDDVEILDDFSEKSDMKIVGGCSNTLVINNSNNLFMLGKEFDYIKEIDGNLHVGCATTAIKLFKYCFENNIKGFEFLSKLPGTLGGLVKMNAGLLGDSISDNMISIRVSKNLFLDKDKLDIRYRYTDINSMVYEAVFEIKNGIDEEKISLINKIRDRQPKEPSLGSCFKNPEDNFAGKLLEESGMKGYKIGNVGFSSKHANFLINYGDGSIEDALKVINVAEERVYENSGVKLEKEIVIL